MSQPDLLLIGGRIHRPGGGAEEGLAIGDGRILATGSSDRMLSLKGSGTRVVELDGRAAIPGLADSHLHLITTGQLLTQVDCASPRTREELLQAIRRRAEALPPDAWVVGRGWSEAALDALPTRSEIDAAAGGRPAFLVRVCGHAALVNTAALALAQIGPGWEPRAEVERDPVGQPTGLIHEGAVPRVRAAVPPPTEAELEGALRAGIRRAAAAGLTQVHTEDMRYIGGRSVAFLLDLYRRVLREEGYPLRVVHLFYHTHLEEVLELGLRTFDGDPFLRVGGIKCFADGGLGGRSALLSEPYADAPHTTGLPAMGLPELSEVYARAAAAGLAVGTHAIGDRAADHVITACLEGSLRAARGDEGSARALRRRLRNRLIHASYLRPDQLAQVREADLVLDIQPRFVYSDGVFLMDRLGPERCRTAYAWRTLLEAGLPCAGGSDSPVEAIDPLLGLWSAVTRQVGETGSPLAPQERLTVDQALDLFTAGPAFAAGWEQDLGAIRPGAAADLTLLDRHPATVDSDQLRSLKVAGTIVAGRPTTALS